MLSYEILFSEITPASRQAETEWDEILYENVGLGGTLPCKLLVPSVKRAQNGREKPQFQNFLLPKQRIVRPLDILVDGLIFYLNSFFLPLFFLSFFFFRHVPSELAERNSTKIGHVVGRKCSLKTHVQNLGYPLPLQIGGPKTTFSTTSQFNGNFKGLYLQNETRYTHNRASALRTTRGLLHGVNMT